MAELAVRDACEQSTKNLCATLYPSVIERYYTQRYCLDINGRSYEDQCVLFHNNRICVVTVAPSHPLIKNQKTVTQVDFQVTEHVNRLNNKVSGKAKRGGQWLDGTSPLCRVKCDDGSEYILHSCLKGKLVEVNEILLTQPQLLVNKSDHPHADRVFKFSNTTDVHIIFPSGQFIPQEDGYIAIVLPKLGQSEPQKEHLLSVEQYRKLIKERENMNVYSGSELG